MDEEKYTQSIRDQHDKLQTQRTHDILVITNLQSENEKLKVRAAKAELLAEERLFRVRELESLLNPVLV